LEHVWNHYVAWGIANPTHHLVLKQLEVWGGLTSESKSAGSAPFAEIQSMAEDAVEQRIIQDLPQQFITAAMRALAETTIEFMRQDAGKDEAYRAAGFEMLWAGIVRKKAGH
jgi:hypothetical protein